jgi:hypothetical protein
MAKSSSSSDTKVTSSEKLKSTKKRKLNEKGKEEEEEEDKITIGDLLSRSREAVVISYLRQRLKLSLFHFPNHQSVKVSLDELGMAPADVMDDKKKDYLKDSVWEAIQRFAAEQKLRVSVRYEEHSNRVADDFEDEEKVHYESGTIVTKDGEEDEDNQRWHVYNLASALQFSSEKDPPPPNFPPELGQ